MQYDVKSAKLSGSGFLILGRTRLKQVGFIGNGTAGSFDIFDTATAPVSATYARSGTTVTVTSSAHGLNTGDTVGISYAAATGVAAVSGNYQITKVNDNSFTITDLNSGSISGGTVCIYVSGGGRWLYGLTTSTGVQPFQILVPGEGILASLGLYSHSSNIASLSVSYG
jgi:hypothetical protein